MSAPHPLEPLAGELGVTVESLTRLGVSRNGSAWRIPERDAEGNVIGHALRRDDGRKLCEAGSKRGLALPWPLDAYAGTSRDNPVLVVEGASDAATGLDLGFPTVGRPCATGGLDHLRRLLADRHVVLVGENDDAGRRGAEKIAQGLASTAASVRVIFPPDGIKDLRKWTAAGLTAHGLRAAIAPLEPVEPDRADTPGAAKLARMPRLLRLSDVEPQPVSWLWSGRVAIGKLTLIAGDPGLGKSFVTLDMAARVSTGKGWPDAPGEQFDTGGVVLLTAEDDAADTIVPRLIASGADRSRIVALQSVTATDSESGEAIDLGLNLSRDVDIIEAAIGQVDRCRLVVVDPITAYLGGVDSHKNAEVRGLLAPLAALAARLGVAVVAVTHLNKSGAGPAIYRTMGSLAFAAAARAVWGVVKDRNDPARRLMLPIKNNLAGDGSGLAFKLWTEHPDATPVVVWEPEPVTQTADEAMSIDAGRPGPDPEDRDAAADWLRRALADGPRLASELIEEATKGELIGKRTLDRARKDVGVVAYRQTIPGPWWWRLPDQDCQSGNLAPSPPKPGNLGNVAILNDRGGLDCPQEHKKSQGCQDRQDVGDGNFGPANRAEKIIAVVRRTDPTRADDLADIVADRLATCADSGMSEDDAAAVALHELERAIAAQGGVE